MDKYTTLIGRILMGHIFLLAGINKIGGFEATQGYMDAMGVPGALLPLVILLEIGGGLALIVGWQIRWAAWALAAFSVIAAAIFHSNFGDQVQMIMFMKNLALSGGLLFIASFGAGELSIDAKLQRGKEERQHSHTPHPSV
ncbi:DoxX family protein [Pseudomonadota bacterium]